MIKKILLLIAILFSMFSFSIAYGDDIVNINISISDDARKSNNTENEHFEKLGKDDDFNTENIECKGVECVYEMIVTIAKYLKNAFYTISGIYFLIISIRFFANKGEEGFTNFKKGVVNISLGIVIMQFAFFFANVIFGVKSGPREIIDVINQDLFLPIIQIMSVFAAIVFIIVAIMAFIRVIVSGGEAEKAKQGYFSIIFAVLGVLLVLFAERLVSIIFGGVDSYKLGNPEVPNTFAGYVFRIINRINGFIGLAVVILIIYSGAQILLSGGDQEKLQSGLKTVVYAFIGMFIIVASYLILTFFIGMPTT